MTSEENTTTITTTTTDRPTVARVLLDLFDARTKRDQILAALAAERDASTNGVKGAFDAAIDFLSSMPTLGRDDARKAILVFLATLPSTTTTTIASGPTVGTVDRELSDELDAQPGDAGAQLPADEPEPSPEPLPLPPSVEPLAVQVQGAQAVASAASAPEQAPESTKASDPESEAADRRTELALEQARAEVPADAPNVYDKCVWLRVRFRRLGTKRDASEDVEVSATTDGSDAKGKTSTSKRILASCEAWRAIEAADAAFRVKAKKMAVPSQLSGIYPIPIVVMENVENDLADYEKVRADLVRELVRAFPDAIEDDKLPQPEGLGPLWRADDYPSAAAVAGQYRMAASWVDMSASTRLSTAMAARNAKAVQEEQREAFAEVRAALRLQVSSMLDELVGILRPDAAGKRRVLQDGRVAKLREWCALFAAKDITGDEQLQATVRRIQGTLDGMSDVKAMRSDDGWRDEIAAKLDTARTELRTLGVTDAPARVFRKRGKKAAAATD